MWLSHERFCEVVAGALDELPADIRDALDNVEVVVEDWPSRRQLRESGLQQPHDLLGLYEGVPQTDRTSDYGLVLPDKITLFRGPILAICADEPSVRAQVQRTVAHELAHHFGIDDDRLEELDAY